MKVLAGRVKGRVFEVEPRGKLPGYFGYEIHMLDNQDRPATHPIIRYPFQTEVEAKNCLEHHIHSSLKEMEQEHGITGEYIDNHTGLPYPMEEN